MLPRLLVFIAVASGAVAAPVSFRAEIAPVLQRRCLTCHNEEAKKGGYRLDSFARLTQPGSSELPAVAPGKTAESELYRLLLEPGPEDRMPQKADPLPEHEIALIERWITEGAMFDGDAPDQPLVELARANWLRPAPASYHRPVPVTALAFNPDATELLASGYFEATLWRTGDGALLRRIGGLPERITALAWHPQTNRIAVAGSSPAQWGTVMLLDPAAGFKPRVLCDLPETALSVVFSPDGSRLAAGCGDRTIRLFDAASGKALKVLPVHADWVQSVAFSPDGKRLVSASRDRTVRIINVETGELETNYSGHDAATTAAVFTPDGSQVLSIARAKSVHLWDASSAARKAEIGGFPSEVQQLAMASVGLITASGDRVVRIHQLSDRATLFTLPGHRDLIQTIAVPPTGETFATGAADGEVCVWDLACGTWKQRFVAKPGGNDQAPMPKHQGRPNDQ